MDGNFAHLCTEYETFDSDKVADIEQFLENNVIQIFIFFRANVVTRDINLYSAF